MKQALLVLLFFAYLGREDNTTPPPWVVIQRENNLEFVRIIEKLGINFVFYKKELIQNPGGIIVAPFTSLKPEEEKFILKQIKNKKPVLFFAQKEGSFLFSKFLQGDFSSWIGEETGSIFLDPVNQSFSIHYLNYRKFIPQKYVKVIGRDENTTNGLIFEPSLKLIYVNVNPCNPYWQDYLPLFASLLNYLSPNSTKFHKTLSGVEYTPLRNIIKVGLSTATRKISIKNNNGFIFLTKDWEKKKLKIYLPLNITLSAGEDKIIYESANIKSMECSRLFLYLSPHKLFNLYFDDKEEEGEYEGVIEVFVNSRHYLTVVNILPLERYIEGVIPGEMPLSFPKQALLAQAVAARSYTLANLGRHSEDGFDVCANAHCQVYKGVTRNAIKITPSEVLVNSEGEVISTFYHSTCGGMTQSNDIKTEEQLLTLLKHNYYPCHTSPLYRWQKNYEKEVVNKKVIKTLLKDFSISIPMEVRDIVVNQYYPSGKVKEVEIDTTAGKWFVEGETMRWMLHLPSAMFVCFKKDNSFTFTGGGWGHGMGLCQWGAKGLAEEGKNYYQILKYFYPQGKIKLINFNKEGN